MGSISKIEWTDSTWNPLRGCSRISEGCCNCYAERTALRFAGPGQPFDGLAVLQNGHAHWTGNVALIEKHLLDPLKWGPICTTNGHRGAGRWEPVRRRRIFVNSVSDLFHENVPDEWIDRIFAVMALCPQHDFQVLTKRPERMLDYLSSGRVQHLILHYIELQVNGGIADKRVFRALDVMRRDKRDWKFPLPNVWLGVSVENQPAADERIPLLLQTPASVRFLSCEPLLGPVDLEDGRGFLGGHTNPECDHAEDSCSCESKAALDWVICGGESQIGARPMHPDWARALREQCALHGVPFFFKQWGEWTSEQVPGLEVELDRLRRDQCVTSGIPGHHTLYTRVGKKLAGCLLDGLEHKAFPEARP